MYWVLGASCIFLLFKVAKRAWYGKFLVWNHVRRIKAQIGEYREDLAAILRGDFGQAREFASALNEPHASFIMTCIDLEEGDFEEAMRCCESVPEPERSVLSKLIALRKESPDTSWMDSLDEAWREVGCPSFAGSTCLTTDLQSSYDKATHVDEMSDVDAAFCEFINATPGENSLSPGCEEWARGIDVANSDLPELLVSLSLLNDGEMSNSMAERLTSFGPENLWVQLSVFCRDNKEQALTSSDLETLLAISRAPEHDLHVCGAEVYERLLEVASRYGSRTPEIAALIGVIGMTTPFISVYVSLLGRIERTKGTALEARAAKVVLQLGLRIMAESRFLIAFVTGRGLLKAASNLHGASAIHNALRESEFEGRVFFNVSKHMSMDPRLWPIRSLQLEGVDALRNDEIGTFRRYIRQES